MTPQILFIDDSQETLLVLMRAARLVGSIPRTARDLETAQKIIAQKPPDVILVDYRMAEMDGISLIRHLRTLPQLQRTRIYLLTAEADPYIHQQALTAGANGTLTKPLDLDALLEVLSG